MDLVIWGHEHESLIHPRPNVETGFDIIQPGSTVATSLVQGESEPKHVCILSVAGKQYKSEAIPLKTIRPLKVADVSLAEDKVTKKLAKKENNRTEITIRLQEIVNEMITQAKKDWRELQGENLSDEQAEPPLPLIRLRVDYTAPEGGAFDLENPQRFSNRYLGLVANVTDVVHYFRKKTTATRKGVKGVELPEEPASNPSHIDSVKVEKLVREYLTAQSLTILPQNSFGDAVTQFVDKDDKRAMEDFVKDSLREQVEHLLKLNGDDEDELQNELEANKSRLEKAFETGNAPQRRPPKLKSKPAMWDSDVDGHWPDHPSARESSDAENSEPNVSHSVKSAPAPATRGRGKQNGTSRAAPTKKTTAATKKPAETASRATRGRKKNQIVDDEDEEGGQDVVMNDADDQDNSQVYPLFVKQTQRGGAKATTKAAPAKKQPTRRAAAAASQATSRGTGVGGMQATEEISDDIEDDNDDDDAAFEPAPTATRSKRKG